MLLNTDKLMTIDINAIARVSMTIGHRYGKTNVLYTLLHGLSNRRGEVTLSDDELCVLSPYTTKKATQRALSMLLKLEAISVLHRWQSGRVKYAVWPRAKHLNFKGVE